MAGNLALFILPITSFGLPATLNLYIACKIYYAKEYAKLVTNLIIPGLHLCFHQRIWTDSPFPW